MARIVGVDLPREKHIWVGLTYIYGIGRTTAYSILERAQVEPATKVQDLTEDEVNRIREAVGSLTLEGDLRREVQQNIGRLIEIGCYRGMRHRRGLPTQGQRTRTNARTRKGRPKTVAGRKRAIVKK